jgi:rhodanese-related sulfurtransferase
MKKLILLLLMIPLLVLVNCKKDSDDPKDPVAGDPYKILTEYMVSNDMDLPDVLDGWITAAPALADVATFIDTYDIIDIRGATDYDAGHIEDALNANYGNLLDVAATTTKPILVVCYTGQSAGHATVALRLSGFNAKVLKWGMSGWNSNNSGPWENSTGDVAINHNSWVSTPTANVVTFNDPVLTGSDGATILENQVAKMLDGGFKGIVNIDVLDNTGGYFINNYWDQVDVDHYGHIAEAYRVKPLSIENGEMKNIDPSKTVATYCWTGQTSSMVTAYLNVIGYNAVSVKFGTNGMIYSILESHKFVTPTVDLPVVTE